MILFSEIVPKTLAVRRPEAWAPRVASVMLWLVQLTGPVRRVAQAVNNQLLRLVPKSIQPLPALSDEEYRLASFAAIEKNKNSNKDDDILSDDEDEPLIAAVTPQASKRIKRNKKKKWILLIAFN